MLPHLESTPPLQKLDQVFWIASEDFRLLSGEDATVSAMPSGKREHLMLAVYMHICRSPRHLLGLCAVLDFVNF